MRLLIATMVAALAVGVAYAQDFPRSRVRMASNLPLSALDIGNISGIANYTSASGRQYAVVGGNDGTAFVNVNIPESPTVITALEGPVAAVREVLVLGDNAYTVSSDESTMQIFDLSLIDRGIVTLRRTFTWSSTGTSFANAFRAAAQLGIVYIADGNEFGGELIAINVVNPDLPKIVGRFPGWYTDVVPTRYTAGPYAGREIVFAAMGTGGMRTLDATNKASITLLGITLVPEGESINSGVLSADRGRLFVTDTQDELEGTVTSMTTRSYDVRNPAVPIPASTFTSGLESIDHRAGRIGNFVMLAGTTEGMRVLRIRTDGTLGQVGFFDSYPASAGFLFAGAFDVNTSSPSGLVLLSDYDNGLFLLDPSEAMGLGVGLVSVTPSRPGAIQALKRIDGNIYLLNAFRTASANVDLTFQTSAPSITGLNIEFYGRSASDSNLVTTLFVRNPRTGNYDRIIGWNLPVSWTTLKNRGPIPPFYVAPDGRIDVRFNFVRPGGVLTAAQIDMIRLDVIE